MAFLGHGIGTLVSASVTAPVSNSSMSPMAIVYVWVVLLMSLLVARTVMSYDAAASRSMASGDRN